MRVVSSNLKAKVTPFLEFPVNQPSYNTNSSSMPVLASFFFPMQ